MKGSESPLPGVPGEIFFPPRRFAGVPAPFDRLETAKVVVLPVPYDSTTDWRSGKREGPQAIIDASQYLELYDLELGREVHTAGIHTLPELQPVMGDPQAMLRRVEAVVRALAERGKIVALLGGEHTLTLGAVIALKRLYPDLSVLYLDAHADLREEYLGTRLSHAAVLRRVLEHCPAVVAGVRSLSLEESRFIQSTGITPFYAHLWDEETPGRIVAALSPQVYVSVDLDVLDPALMPAVGTPEPGGVSWPQLLALLRQVASARRVVGFDVVEFSPRDGPIACAYLAAKLVYKLIGYLSDGKG